MLTLVVTLNLLMLTINVAVLSLLAFVFERALTFESRARRDMQRHMQPFKPPKPLPRQPIVTPKPFSAPASSDRDRWDTAS